MALEIKDIILTQMQKPVIIFSPPVVDEPITFTADNGTHNISFVLDAADIKEGIDDNGNVIKCARIASQLVLNTTYDISLTTDSESDDTNFNTVLDVDNSLRIQQAVYDIITSDIITDSFGRDLNFIDNGLFIPEDITDGESMSVTVPFLSVGKPKLKDIESFGNAINILTHELSIKIADEPVTENVNDVTHLHNMALEILRRLKAKSDLGLRRWGIISENISYLVNNINDINDDDPLNSIIIDMQITQYQSK